MKVYVAENGWGSDHIVGVFSTKEHALEQLRRLNIKEDLEQCIQEWNLDDYLPHDQENMWRRPRLI